MAADGAGSSAVVSTAELERQCSVFCRYLTGGKPDAHVLSKYVDGVQRIPELKGPVRGFEAVLLQVASTHPTLTRTIDLYARFFRPGAQVRKRLVFLFALLESWGATAHHFDDSDGSGPIGFALRLALVGLWIGLLLVAAIVVLGPMQVLLPHGARTLSGTGGASLK